MKMKVKQFLSHGDLIIYDVKVNGEPLRLPYGKYIPDSIINDSNFQKSMKSGVIKKCIDNGWIEIEKEVNDNVKSKEESAKKVDDESKNDKKEKTSLVKNLFKNKE
jgi:hypothetical protein